MLEKIKTRCRDECINNISSLSERLQTNIEYFQIAVENDDRKSMRRWANILANDMEDYSDLLRVIKWTI